MSANGQPPAGSLAERMIASYDARIPPHVRAVIGRAALEKLPDAPTVVDLGCGPGLWLRDAAAVRPDAALIGYDRDGAALDAARSLALPRARWHQTDITAPDFALTAPVHVAAMHFFFHFLDDPRPLLRTVRASLAPEGSLVLTGWVRSSLADFLAFFAGPARQDMESTQPAEGRGTPDPDATALRMWASFNRYTFDDWRWLLQREGFMVRRADQYTGHFAYIVARVAE